MSFLPVSKAAAEPVAKSEWTEFKGHYVYNGQVQRTWGEAFSRTDISSLQNEYNKEHPNSKEGPTWKKPFIFISNAASNLVDMIRNAFKAVFFCFAEVPKDGAGAGQKKDTKKADTK